LAMTSAIPTDKVYFFDSIMALRQPQRNTRALADRGKR